MPLHLLPLLVGKLALLVEDGFADGNLADVMHQAEQLHLGNLQLAHFKSDGKGFAKIAYPTGVKLFPLVLLMQGVDDGIDRTPTHVGRLHQLASVDILLSMFDDLIDVIILAIHLTQAKADGGPYRVHYQHLRDLRADLRDDHFSFLFRRIEKYQGHLVASDPGSIVLLSDTLLDNGCDPLQEQIPLLPSKGIVYDPQAIHITESYSKGKSPH